MEVSGRITAIQKFSVHDGPGIRTTVFFKGCPFQCPWCSNPETQSLKPDLLVLKSRCIGCGSCASVCPVQAVDLNLRVPEVDRSRCLLCGICEKNCPAGALSVKGEEWTVSQLMEELKKDEVFYQSSGGGITFSGGEPLLQPEFLVKTAAACRSRGYHTALETAAFASEEVMEQVMPYIDLFLCDLKLIDEKDHQMKTGVSNRMILRNLLRLREAGKQVILRIPVIPGYTDGDENLMGIGDFAAKEGFTEIHLLPYHNYGEAKYKQLGRIYALEGIPPMKQEDLEKVKNQMEKNFGLHVKIGG